MKTTVIKKELQVPSSAMFAVAEIISDNEITHTITGVDEDEDTIALEVEYSKKERDIIRDIENVIEDHEEENDDDADEE